MSHVPRQIYFPPHAALINDTDLPSGIPEIGYKEQSIVSHLKNVHIEGAFPSRLVVWIAEPVFISCLERTKVPSIITFITYFATWTHGWKLPLERGSYRVLAQQNRHFPFVKCYGAHVALLEEKRNLSGKKLYCVKMALSVHINPCEGDVIPQLS